MADKIDIPGGTFQDKILEIGRIIENRIIERRTRAEKNVIHPRDFAFVIRKGELRCVWCRNLVKAKKAGKIKNVPARDKERVYWYISNPHLGLELDEWRDLTKGLCQTFSIEY